MKQNKTKVACIIVVIALFIITFSIGVYAYKYNQYKSSFNKAMCQLDNKRYDDSISAFMNIANTYFGRRNSEEIKKEIERAKKLNANKKIYDEALNIKNAKYEAKCYNYDSAIKSINLVLTLDADNKEAIILKDEYVKKKKLGFDYAVQDDSIKIVKCFNDGMYITIPEVIDGKSVSTIGDESFFQHKDMISVTLPQSITSIEGSAFYRCYLLEKIIIPKNVKYMGANPFFRCSSLTQIFVNSDNRNFSELNGVLYNKDKSVLLAYPEGKTDESFIVPNSVIKIDDSAFGYHCKKLKTIIIPSNVINFPDYNMFVYPDQITLKVKSGSAAEQYAKRNNLKFEIY